MRGSWRWDRRCAGIPGPSEAGISPRAPGWQRAGESSTRLVSSGRSQENSQAVTSGGAAPPRRSVWSCTQVASTSTWIETASAPPDGALAFAAHAQKIVYRTGHMQLLSDPAVGRIVSDWLAQHPTARH